MTPEEEDAIATMIPRSRDMNPIAKEAVGAQEGKLETIGNYIAASLDSKFRGDQAIILEGECVATVRIFDRLTGRKLGESTVPVEIAFDAKHQR